MWNKSSGVRYLCMWIRQCGLLWLKISHHAQNHARKLTIFLLLPRPFVWSSPPSPSGTLWTPSRLPRAYLSKMAESALAARAKIRLHCTLKHRVQQFILYFHLQPQFKYELFHILHIKEYNSLLVNVLNRIFESNLSLNNFKWLLTKLELSCVRNIIPRSKKRLWNGYPVQNQELQNHDPVGRHIPVWVMYGSTPPPPPRVLLDKPV